MSLVWGDARTERLADERQPQVTRRRRQVRVVVRRRRDRAHRRRNSSRGCCGLRRARGDQRAARVGSASCGAADVHRGARCGAATEVHGDRLVGTPDTSEGSEATRLWSVRTTPSARCGCRLYCR